MSDPQAHAERLRDTFQTLQAVAPKNALTALLDGKKTIIGTLFLALWAANAVVHFLPQAWDATVLGLAVTFLGVGASAKMDKARGLGLALLEAWNDLRALWADQMTQSALAAVDALPVDVPTGSGMPTSAMAAGHPLGASIFGFDWASILGKLLPLLLSGQMDFAALKVLPKGEEVKAKGLVRGIRFLGRSWRFGVLLQAEDDPVKI